MCEGRSLTTMSQKNVERVIGKLVTDEEYRSRFRIDPEAAVRELVQKGLELTTCEWNALVHIDAQCCDSFANVLDPRLQKASLKGDLAWASHGCSHETESPGKNEKDKPERSST